MGSVSNSPEQAFHQAADELVSALAKVTDAADAQAALLKAKIAGEPVADSDIASGHQAVIDSYEAKKAAQARYDEAHAAYHEDYPV